MAGALGWLQATAPRYTDAALGCGAFLERVETAIRLQGRGAAQDETTHRDGVIRFRSDRNGPVRRFEAWYDALALWRDSPLGRLAPETDGLLGGRWRGWLGASGGVELEARPFIPPEVREVADLAELFADFFPPLAPVPLAVGARWSDSTGLEVQRLADSAAPGRPLRRFAWRLEATGAGDSAVVLSERVVDRGTLVWDDALGPVAWSREVEVTSEFRRRPAVPEPLRSRVLQRITVRRDPGGASCG